jgi:hypothetical protein
MNSRSHPRTTSFTASAVALLASVCAALVLGACADPADTVEVEPAVMEAWLQDKPEALHDEYARVLTGGERNRVLSHLEAGLEALEMGERELAADSFDEALLGIETVFSDSERAEQARSLWYEEGRKDFKGEPYERAMAYYYRGLLDLMAGDYDNARASFKAGILQDAYAEEEQHRADFALLMFLEGWASHCAGDRGMAAEAFDETRGHRTWFEAPDRESNCLVLVETGTAPRKVAGGEHEQMLTYERGSSQERGAGVMLGGEEQRLAEMEDVYWQSSTRGGRGVDAIIEGKVKFKDTTDAAGNVLAYGGLKAMELGSHIAKAGDRDKMLLIGAGAALVGLIGKGVSSQVEAGVDTRSWDNLPDRVHVFTTTLPDGFVRKRGRPVDGKEFVPLKVVFYDRRGNEVASRTYSRGIETPDGRFYLAWVRSPAALEQLGPENDNDKDGAS